MSQREIDDEEWRNPDNWSGVWPFNAYFSKRDSRIFVPQFFNSRFSPRTPNFGHRLGFPVVCLLYVVVIFMTAVIGWMVGRG